MIGPRYRFNLRLEARWIRTRYNSRWTEWSKKRINKKTKKNRTNISAEKNQTFWRQKEANFGFLALGDK